jgi:hypothetical protein
VHENNGSAPGRIRLIDFALFAFGQHIHHLSTAISADLARGGARRILALIVVESIALVTICGDNSVSPRVVAANKPSAKMWA